MNTIINTPDMGLPSAQVDAMSAKSPTTFSPAVPLLGCSGSDFSEDSPSLGDSLLSLDFELYDGSTQRSGSLSDSSPLLATPTATNDSVTMTNKKILFSPLHDVMFPPLNGLPETGSERPAKRACLSHERTPVIMPNMQRDLTPIPGDSDASTRASLCTDATSTDVFQLLNTLNAQQPLELPPTATSMPSLPEPFSVTPQLEHSEPRTASLSEISVSPSTPLLDTASVNKPRGTRRRRREVDELLPLDAPIQPRTYHTESATSRRDSIGSKRAESVSPDAELLMDGQEMDARSLKRLSNTLAARRSRHRKAEELKRLHDTIETLQNEVAMWKQRCERAEAERDRACIATAAM